MAKSKINRAGFYCPTVLDIGRLRGDIDEANRRPKNEHKEGPRISAIKEYVYYKREDGENATHEEKMDHVIKFLETKGYGEPVIENAKRWIDDFVNNVTDKFGRPIQNSGSQQGDDNDAR